MNIVLKILLTTSILQLSSIFAQSAEINGRVVDKSGEPLAGVNVYLEGTVLGSASDKMGLFQISRVPQGTFILKFSMVGYQQEDTTLIINAGIMIDIGAIVLTEIAIQSQPIVVTASKYAQNLQDIPLSISSVSAQEISYRNATRVDEALKYVSGVNMNRDQVNIRGSNGYSYGVGSRIMLLIDGIPYITGDSQALVFESIPVNQIETIEVQKGAGSALYGSNALGGVINILTKPIEEKPETNIRFYGGLYDSPYHEEWKWSDRTRYLHGLYVKYSQKIKDIGFSFGVSKDENDSHRMNDWNRRYNISTKVEYDVSPFSRLMIYANYMDQRRENFLYWQNLNNALVPADDQIGERVEAQRYNISTTFRQIFSDKQFYKVSAIWFHNRFEDNIGLNGNSSSSDYINLDFQYNVDLEKHFLTFGLSPTYNRVASDIFGSRIGYNMAIYIQDDIKVTDIWQLSTGLRYDVFEMQELESDQSLNPKFGVVAKPYDDTAFRASMGSGFRAPSMAEAFTSTAAGGLIVRPNPDLKPERSVSSELGWNQIYGTSLYTDAAVFYNYFWDLIEGGFVQSEDQTENFLQFNNVTEARVFGLELNLNWQIWANQLFYHFGYTYTNSRDIALKTDLKYRPRHIFYTDIKYKFASFLAGIDYRYLSKYENIDDTFALIIPDAEERVSIHVLDIRLSRDFKLLDLSLQISLQVNNVLQYNYVDVIGTIAPIRNYVITIDTKL